MSRLAEASIAAFFREASREHAEAQAIAPEVARTLRFGQRELCLRFAGSALADRLLPALESRLTAAGGRPYATIGLWEERTVGSAACALPWRDVDLGPRGLVRRRLDDRVVAVHEAGSGAVTLVDREAREILYRVPAADAVPWWEQAAPLRPAFFWALGGQSRCLVHAGAVGDRARGGVLLAGPGGSGKTTVALAALAAGFDYVSDDYLLLEAEPEPIARNLYGTAKLDNGHLARFPEFAATIRVSPTEPDEKAVLNVAELTPESLIDFLPIRAVLLPHVRGGRAVLRRTSAAQALLALAPSTALQMPFDRGEAMSSLAGVVRQVPCFALDIGDNMEELAGTVDRALDEALTAGGVESETVAS